MRPDVVFSLGSSLTLSHRSASSFFESGLARDSTWFNPRSRLPHCPTTSSSALVTLIKRCVKCSTKLGYMHTNSDHSPVKIELRLVRNPKKRLTKPRVCRDFCSSWKLRRRSTHSHRSLQSCTPPFQAIRAQAWSWS